MANNSVNPIAMLRPRRRIVGMSAILLPYDEQGRIDWDGFRAHVARTFAAGLIPAVNMDTGYVNLLTAGEKRQVLTETRALAGGTEFVAGAFVRDAAGDDFNLDAYRRAIDDIGAVGGTPVIFQSYGLTSLPGERVLEAYWAIAKHCTRFIGFELGTMFAPFGRIYDLDTYAGLMAISECIGAKHSSLDRQLEWQRLQLRDERRPEFMVLTGNDLGIDMVMYGSDYLLGLSTFAPDLFAKRDVLWQAGDPAFYEVNDVLQYLGFFAFRAPVPAYKHSAAQFLKLRGWIASDSPHPNGLRRPDSDVEVLRDIIQRF
ncbi:MAG TPA: dihydrodipicolinate synthase family protein [Gemmataceae bacterium]|jgi:dihydrodipicolinate synthase/N-acetylneuraminate lyase|nr:dihydrodipicolinate synthase family protein [Gemmataceae bacterium]